MESRHARTGPHGVWPTVTGSTCFPYFGRSTVVAYCMRRHNRARAQKLDFRALRTCLTVQDDAWQYKNPKPSDSSAEQHLMYMCMLEAIATASVRP